MNEKATPAEAKPLVKDTDREDAQGDFSFSSIIGMLLYLVGTFNEILHMLLTVLHAICYVQDILMNFH